MAKSMPLAATFDQLMLFWLSDTSMPIVDTTLLPFT